VFEPGPSLTLEPGWVAPVYGRRVDAPVVSAVVEGVADANFVTLVVPLAGSDPLPELRVRREDGRTEVEVDGRAVAWRLDAGELVLEAGEW
jgi:hypothetical protein